MMKSPEKGFETQPIVRCQNPSAIFNNPHSPLFYPDYCIIYAELYNWLKVAFYKIFKPELLQVILDDRAFYLEFEVERNDILSKSNPPFPSFYLK